MVAASKVTDHSADNTSPGEVTEHLLQPIHNNWAWLPPASAVGVIESVSSVCVSVIQHSHGWTIWCMDKKFYMPVNLVHI